jgi:hypothetical protein
MEHSMSNHRITRLIVVGAVGAGGVAAVTALPVTQAGAASAPVNITLKCSGTSMVNLQLQREDTGKVSVDFGVDMARHKAGVQWNVTETNNGVTFVNKSVKTIRDGSFSITSVLAPAASNAVVGTAVNPITGETCGISGTV